MVLNPGKCHYIVVSDDDPTHNIIFSCCPLIWMFASQYLEDAVNSIYQKPYI